MMNDAIKAAFQARAPPARALPALAEACCNAAAVVRTRSACLLCSKIASRLEHRVTALDISRSHACRSCACRRKTRRQPEARPTRAMHACASAAACVRLRPWAPAGCSARLQAADPGPPPAPRAGGQPIRVQARAARGQRARAGGRRRVRRHGHAVHAAERPVARAVRGLARALPRRRPFGALRVLAATLMLRAGLSRELAEAWCAFLCPAVTHTALHAHGHAGLAARAAICAGCLRPGFYVSAGVPCWVH